MADTAMLEAQCEYTSLDLDDQRGDELLAVACRILQLTDQEILTVFDCVVKAKPRLRKVALSMLSKSPKRSSSDDILSEAGSVPVSVQARELSRALSLSHPTEDDPLLASPLDDGPWPAEGDEPAVQFSCASYYVSETEDTVSVQVMRIGNLESKARVAYETQDVSAVSGKAYEASSGVIVFKPGEAWKAIDIKVIDNEEWDTTVSFSVELLKKGLLGAVMSETLSKASVNIINDDAFPTNRYTQEIQSGHDQLIPPVGLLMEYMKLQWSHPIIRSGTKKLLLVGLYHNVHFVVKLFMHLFMLKSILVAADTEAEALYKRRCLVIIALLIFLPFIMSHFLEYYKFNWKVGGMSRALLQKGLLRKYMSCDAAARFELQDGVVIMAVARDCQDLVAFGYMGAIALVNVMSHLFLLCAFQFLAPTVFKLPPRLTAFLPMITFPVVLVVGMALRNQKSIQVLFDRNNRQVELVERVVETAKDYQLIVDYECRGKFIQQFEKQVTEFNVADMKALKLLVNNAHFTPWITTIFVAGYTYFGGEDVIGGSLSLAMFLTNIAVFTQMGAAYNQILNICVEIQTAFPALLRITRLLNLSSDDNTRMGWTRFQSDTSRKIASQIDEDKQNGLLCAETPEFDMLPIRVRNLKLVHYHLADKDNVTSDLSDNIDQHFQYRGSIEIPQGKLISIIGPHSGGKSTLLKVFGGALLPHLEMVTAGQIFLPCHLRIVHVPSETIFFRGTLSDNLTFGVREGHESDGSKERVEAILRLLGLPDSIVNLMEDDNIHGNHWLEVICLSQRFLLAIARALIANPQVLCIHKPTEKFSEAEGKRVLSVLKQFVEDKGLMQGPPTIRTRPRTCLMTNVSLFAKDYADDMVQVSREGMKVVDKKTVTRASFQD